MTTYEIILLWAVLSIGVTRLINFLITFPDPRPTILTPSGLFFTAALSGAASAIFLWFLFYLFGD